MNLQRTAASRLPDWNFALDPAAEFCVAVSQAKQGPGKNVAGAKTETDGSAADAEELAELG
jgi:hypothetical protein